MIFFGSQRSVLYDRPGLYKSSWWYCSCLRWCVYVSASFSLQTLKYCGGLSGGSPKRYGHVLISRTWEWNLIWKRGLCLCNDVQDLEVRRSPGMIWGSSKSKGKYPSEKEAERDLGEKRRTCKQGGRDRREAATGQGALGPPEARKGRKACPLEPPGI